MYSCSVTANMSKSLDNGDRFYSILHASRVFLLNNNNNNNTHISSLALLSLTMHPQLWEELLTFKPKCTLPF